MALRDQPYIPLYVQDIMTDEKLNECEAATHGIYIKGIMCLMHKSETYGKILLKQKYKQIAKQENSVGYAFACQLDKHLPYTQIEIYRAIQDLLRENVCYIEDDYLCQKRMIKDGDISFTRSKVGKKGGLKTQKLAKANLQANSEYEYANEYENEISNEVKDLANEISEKWNFSELSNFGQYSKLCHFIAKFGIKKIESAFEGYWSYKESSGERTHSFKNWMGAAPDYEGGWNERDWGSQVTKKLNEEEILANVEE